MGPRHRLGAHRAEQSDRLPRHDWAVSSRSTTGSRPAPTRSPSPTPASAPATTLATLFLLTTLAISGGGGDTRSTAVGGRDDRWRRGRHVNIESTTHACPDLGCVTTATPPWSRRRCRSIPTRGPIFLTTDSVVVPTGSLLHTTDASVTPYHKADYARCLPTTTRASATAQRRRTSFAQLEHGRGAHRVSSSRARLSTRSSATASASSSGSRTTEARRPTRASPAAPVRCWPPDDRQPGRPSTRCSRTPATCRT